MRIGFISTYPPLECGIGTYTQDLVEGLRQDKIETFVITPFGAQGKDIIPVYSWDSKSFATDVYNATIRLTPDVVHIQHEFGLYGQLHGVAVVDLLIRYAVSEIPVITTLHTVPVHPEKREKNVLKHISKLENGEITKK